MIKIDIGMPEYCYDCPCHDGEYGKCRLSGEYTCDKRPYDCPLIPCGNGEDERAEGIRLTIDENGVAKPYDDTYDIVIHCESKEEQEKAWEIIKRGEKTKNEQEYESAKWIPVHPLQSDDCGAYMCSRCKTGMWEIKPSIYHYCPNCGKRMQK